MALKPDLDSWDFSDLEALRDNQIPESNILDYKSDLISNRDLIKQICGFANANGGFLIFGVEESDDEPAHPASFPGIVPDDLNAQQIEQVINTSIVPRLSVRTRVLELPDSEKLIFLVYVPEGPEQPYYSLQAHKFYLRYERETREMTEAEISARYSERFVSEDRVKNYVHQTIVHHRNIAPRTRESGDAPGGQRQAVYGHILVYPPNISRRRVDTTAPDVFDFSGQDLRFPPNENVAGADFRPGDKRPGRFGVEWFLAPLHLNPTRLEVHRNGLVHHADDYGGLYRDQFGNVDELELYDQRVAAKLIGTLLFADLVYQEIEYLGPVIVKLRISNVMGIHMREERARHLLGPAAHGPSVSPSDEIQIERECNSWELSEQLPWIAKNIMDEFANHFGLWTYPEFLPRGRLHYLLQDDEE